MEKIKLYLDNCCFNRPYDDQSSIVIKIETEAKLYVQLQIKNDVYSLVWSYILDYENSMNPFPSKKNAIKKWKDLSSQDIEETNEILKIIIGLENYKILGKDAVHIACAIYSKVDFFLTTDYKLIKKSSSLVGLSVVNPVDFVKIEEALKNESN